MHVLRTLQQLRAWRESLPRDVCLGLVPTMGALHEGHATLMREAKKGADVVLATVFVNPAQFAPTEDLSKYPRTWEADVELLQQEGVDAVFAPAPEEMYGLDYSTWVVEERESQGLCGEFRPGHFKGVATVVLKLFLVSQAHRAWFGLKDLQQFAVISKMVRDLGVPIEVIGVPTVREPDGLALSSRNRYLNPEQRERASGLYRVLTEAGRAIASGEPEAHVCRQAIQKLQDHGWSVQYFEIRGLDGKNYLAAAAFLGTTRLIDNVALVALNDKISLA